MGGRLGVASGAMLVVLAALPTLWRLRIDPLDAAGIYALASALLLGLTSLMWLDATPRRPPPGVDPSDVSDALLLTAAGVAAFGVGARLTGPARRRPPLELPASAAPSILAMVGVFAVGAMALGAGLAVGVLGYNARGAAAEGSTLFASAQLFSNAAELGTFVVLICALAAFATGGRHYGRLLVVVLVLQSAAGFVAGYKLQVVLPLVLAGLGYVACRGRIPWRAVVIGAVVTALLVAPANRLYRQYLRPDRTVSAGDAVEGGSTVVSNRIRLIDSVALIDVRTPSVYPRGDGDRYLYLPALIAVPRAVWPEKPVFNEGLEFSNSYWQLPSRYRTLTPLTQVGDLLRNFGAAGVVVGLCLWGVVLGLFTLVCRRLRSLRTEVVYLVALATGVPLVEMVLPELLTGAARTLPVAAAVAWFLLPGPRGPAGYRRVHAWLRTAGGRRAAHAS